MAGEAPAEAVAAQMADLSVAAEPSWANRVTEHQPYYHKRIELFNQFKQRQLEAMEAAKAANVPIKVVLPDGAGEGSCCDAAEVKYAGLSGWLCQLHVAPMGHATLRHLRLAALLACREGWSQGRDDPDGHREPNIEGPRQEDGGCQS